MLVDAGVLISDSDEKLRIMLHIEHGEWLMTMGDFSGAWIVDCPRTWIFV